MDAVESCSPKNNRLLVCPGLPLPASTLNSKTLSALMICDPKGVSWCQQLVTLLLMGLRIDVLASVYFATEIFVALPGPCSKMEIWFGSGRLSALLFVSMAFNQKLPRTCVVAHARTAARAPPFGSFGWRFLMSFWMLTNSKGRQIFDSWLVELCLLASTCFRAPALNWPPILAFGCLHLVIYLCCFNSVSACPSSNLPTRLCSTVQRNQRLEESSFRFRGLQEKTDAHLHRQTAASDSSSMYLCAEDFFVLTTGFTGPQSRGPSFEFHLFLASFRSKQCWNGLYSDALETLESWVEVHSLLAWSGFRLLSWSSWLLIVARTEFSGCLLFSFLL